jgi:acetyl-CoA carboxylase biotin carboxylase subunit
MVTGLDLVKEQVRIAAGEQLGYRQEDIAFRGSAIECRVNAESPDTYFPSPGKLTTFHPPVGIGVRVDSAAYNEYVITPHYDSLIAKIICWGKDRTEAIRRMHRALEMTIVEGVQTTIPLHQRILADEDFRAGKIDTHFLERFNRD